MHYRASLDLTAKLITSAVMLLFLILTYRLIFILDQPLILRVVIIAIFVITAITAWLYAPQNYTIDGSNLTVNRIINKITIPLAEIKSARKIERKELGTLIRLWGSGGMFGYYGTFRSTRMGKLKLYTTRKSNLILISTVDEDLILISPDDVTLMDTINIPTSG